MVGRDWSGDTGPYDKNWGDEGLNEQQASSEMAAQANPDLDVSYGSSEATAGANRADYIDFDPDGAEDYAPDQVEASVKAPGENLADRVKGNPEDDIASEGMSREATAEKPTVSAEKPRFAWNSRPVDSELESLNDELSKDESPMARAVKQEVTGRQVTRLYDMAMSALDSPTTVRSPAVGTDPETGQPRITGEQQDWQSLDLQVRVKATPITESDVHDFEEIRGSLRGLPRHAGRFDQPTAISVHVSRQDVNRDRPNAPGSVPPKDARQITAEFETTNGGATARLIALRASVARNGNYRDDTQSADQLLQLDELTATRDAANQFAGSLRLTSQAHLEQDPAAAEAAARDAELADLLADSQEGDPEAQLKAMVEDIKYRAATIPQPELWSVSCQEALADSAKLLIISGDPEAGSYADSVYRQVTEMSDRLVGGKQSVDYSLPAAKAIAKAGFAQVMLGHQAGVDDLKTRIDSDQAMRHFGIGANRNGPSLLEEVVREGEKWGVPMQGWINEHAANDEQDRFALLLSHYNNTIEDEGSREKLHELAYELTQTESLPDGFVMEQTSEAMAGVDNPDLQARLISNFLDRYGKIGPGVLSHTTYTNLIKVGQQAVLHPEFKYDRPDLMEGLRTTIQEDWTRVPFAASKFLTPAQLCDNWSAMFWAHTDMSPSMIADQVADITLHRFNNGQTTNYESYRSGLLATAAIQFTREDKINETQQTIASMNPATQQIAYRECWPLTGKDQMARLRPTEAAIKASPNLLDQYWDMTAIASGDANDIRFRSEMIAKELEAARPPYRNQSAANSAARSCQRLNELLLGLNTISPSEAQRLAKQYLPTIEGASPVPQVAQLHTAHSILVSSGKAANLARVQQSLDAATNTEGQGITAGSRLNYQVELALELAPKPFVTS